MTSDDYTVAIAICGVLIVILLSWGLYLNRKNK